jgi:acetylornithine deacetylase
MSHTSARADLEASIASSVNALRSEMVSTLQQLVQTPSQTGREGQAQKLVAQLMRDQGLEVDVWEPDIAQLAPYAASLTLDAGFTGRPNVVGRQRGAGGGRSLILNGHIDTVEVGAATGWDLEPLGGMVIDGHLYGRGACDMKGGLVANMFALRALLRAGFVPAGDVFLQSTVSEEDGGAGALSAVLRGYVADGAIITEPTDLTIVPAQGGSLMFRLHVSGLAAHACVRDEGVSAIENFAYLHRGLLAFESRHNDEIAHPLYANIRNKAPLNIGTIHGGTWPSSVPEDVVAEGRAGLVPGEDLEALKSQLTGEVLQLATGHPWLASHPPRIEWLDGQFAAAEVAADEPLVVTLGAALERVTGASPRIEGVTYGADMRHFVLTGGMPCVLFGAGDIRLAHAPHESISLDDLCRSVAVLAFFIAEWCGVAIA